MSSDNTKTPLSDVESDLEISESGSISTGHAAYNVVSDTVVGLNVRKADNKFQAIFILVAVLLLAAVGTLLAVLNSDWQLPWYGGALMGAFAGLVIGVLVSGIFLMFYRGLRHLNGKHE